MLRLSDIARKMFRRGATDRPKDPFRTRLGLDSLEDRVVPATVTATTIDDALENLVSGTIRLARDGSTASSLAVNFAISGSAVSGTDYDLSSSEFIFMSFDGTFSITIPSGVSTLDLSIDAIGNGLSESDESVVITILSGSYTIGSSGAATVTIQDDDLPAVAFDGSETTSVNTPVDVAVLDLATQLDGNTLDVIDVTLGDYGSTFINWDGSITYTPDTDFIGEDSFTYTVEDEFGNQAIGTVTVTVTGPIAPPTSVWTAMNTPVTVEVLELAFDPDEDTLTTTAVTQGSHGTVVLNLDGTVTYTPTTSYTGDDSFTYTVEDPDGNEASHTITVTVGPIDPIALDDEASTPVNTAVNIAVLDIAFDPEGDTLDVISVTQGAHGTVVIETDGTVTYTPGTNFTGTDTFTYTVEDDDSNASTGTITVTVGTPAPSDVDEIIEDLEEIEEEIENYDEDTLVEILDDLPDILTAGTNYLAGVTSYISTNSINSSGMSLSIADLFSLVEAHKNMYKEHNTLLGLYDLVGSVVTANRLLIEELSGQLKTAQMAVPPNIALINDLIAKTQLAVNFQTTLYTEVYLPIDRAIWRSFTETKLMYRALKAAAPPAIWLQLGLLPPSIPSPRVQITP